jgi:NitT/TauT family transport system permease protein
MIRIPALAYTATIVFLLFVWQAASLFLGETLLPGPCPTIQRMIQEAGEGLFWAHVGTSAFRVVCGLVLAFLTAVPLGLALGSSPRLDRWFSPLVYLSYPVPKVVFLPIVLLLFGLGNTGKVVLLTLILFFQLLITTRDSARQIDPEIIYSFRSLSDSRWHYFRHVVWPVSLPGIFTSLRVGTGISVAVLFFLESIGTRFGLGFFIIDSWGRADYTGMFVGIVALSGIGIVLYEWFDLLERRLCSWKNL